MPAFDVSYYRTTNYRTTVQASTEQEAMDIVAYGDYFTGEFETSTGYDVDDASEVLTTIPVIA